MLLIIIDISIATSFPRKSLKRGLFQVYEDTLECTNEAPCQKLFYNQRNPSLGSSSHFNSLCSRNKYISSDNNAVNDIQNKGKHVMGR